MSSTNTPIDPFRSLAKHEKYYIPGADLFFLVENIHFRVHRYFFERESGYFVSKLATPASPGKTAQGTQESNAILLEDVSADHFAIFLWVFYNPRYSLYDASIADWEVVLRLSVLWDFPEVKNLAVRELEKKDIPDAKRIKLYHENKVDRNILIPRYAALCEREAHLTIEEATDLGMETVVMIAACRGEARSPRLPNGSRSPVSPTIAGNELHSVVREIFKIEPPSENKETTGGLQNPPIRPPIQPPQIKIPTTKKPTAPTPTAPTPISQTPKTKTKRKGPTVVAKEEGTGATDALGKGSAAQSPDGIDDKSFFESNMDATKGNTTTEGTDDLLGLSFIGSKQPPSQIIPPSSLFGDSFSAFGNMWS